MSTSALPKMYDASPLQLEANEKEVPQQDVKNVFGQEDEVEGVAHAATARGLLPHHIQLIGIGSTIGVGIWLGCGRTLVMAGPLGSLIAYMLYCAICWGVSVGTGEIAAFLPIRGGFITCASKFIDPAAGFAVGWNYFYAGTMFACADITASAGFWAFWFPDVNPAAWISLAMVIIICLNVYSVRYYGESEFWFASLKIILMLSIILMTIVVMLGGNPIHDRIGFRYWRDPGVWTSYYKSGPLGRFLGFWNCFKVAAYSVGGPEYVSMCAGEAVHPRRTIPRAMKGILARLTIFFFLGILACGILVPYNDEVLIKAIATGVGSNASAYVVGMRRVGIKYMPDFFNACVITSTISCANGYAYISSRVLHSLAATGQAPKFFARTTQKGIPVYSLILVFGIFALSYMQVSTNAAVVFGWFINLSSVAQLLNYIFMCIIALRFRAAMKRQGLNTSILPWSHSYTVPYTWACLVTLVLIVLTQGWEVFTKGGWDTQTFLTCYFGLGLVVVLYTGWKLYHKTHFVSLDEMDLTSRIEEFDALDEMYVAERMKPKSRWARFMDFIG